MEVRHDRHRILWGLHSEVEAHRMSIFQNMGWFAPATVLVAQGERSFCNWDEDSVSMGVEASRDCLKGLDKIQGGRPLPVLHHAAFQRPPLRGDCQNRRSTCVTTFWPRISPTPSDAGPAPF